MPAGARPGVTAIAVLLLAVAANLLGVQPATAVGYDYGDAPAGYDAAADGPARAALGGPRLGRLVTADPVDPETGVSTYASVTALGDTGDDGTGPLPALTAGRLQDVDVELTLTATTAPARLCGWVDFDLDQTFGPAERSCVSLALGATDARLRWVGRPVAPGSSYARFRIGSTAAQVEEPTGTSGSGEVEDYPVTFGRDTAPRAGLSLTTTPSPASVRRAGQVVTVGYDVRNSGEVPLTDVRVTDDGAGLDQVRCPPRPAAALAPAAWMHCTATVPVTQADLDAGSLELVAEARAEAPGGRTDDASDDVLAVGAATVDAVQRSRLVVNVTSGAQARSGARARVAVRVRNAGNTTLSRVRVTVSVAGQVVRRCRTALAPEASATCRGRHTVSAAEARRGRVVLRGSVRAEAPYGDPAQAADDVRAAAERTLAVRGAGAGPTSVTPAGSPVSDPASGPTRLADTGGASVLILGYGSLALLAGLVLLARSRRRAEH